MTNVRTIIDLLSLNSSTVVRIMPLSYTLLILMCTNVAPGPSCDGYYCWNSGICGHDDQCVCTSTYTGRHCQLENCEILCIASGTDMCIFYVVLGMAYMICIYVRTCICMVCECVCTNVLIVC